MMKALLILPILLMPILLSCEKEIDVKVPVTESQIVTYAFVYPDSSLSLHLSKSVSIVSDQPFDFVQNAEVKIRRNGLAVVNLVFPSNSVQTQWSNVKCAPDDSLSLEIYIPEKGYVTANSVILPKIDIVALDTLTEMRKGGANGDKEYLKCTLQFADDASSVDYYQLVVVRHSVDKDGKKKITTIDVLKEDPVFLILEQSGGISQWFDFKGLFSDVLINGVTHRLNFLIDKGLTVVGKEEQSAHLVVYLYHHNFDYFNYLKTTIWAKGTDLFPVFDPVRIHSNIKNGLGLFTGMNFDSRRLDLLP